MKEKVVVKLHLSFAKIHLCLHLTDQILHRAVAVYLEKQKGGS